MTDEEKARNVAHAWIRDDASTGIKMMLTVDGCDELIKRIATALKEAREKETERCARLVAALDAHLSHPDIAAKIRTGAEDD